MYPKEFRNLINYFKKLPGVGEKSAERLALSILDLSTDDVNSFASSLVESKNNLHPCNTCGFLTDKDECDICSSAQRNKNLICVLEDYKSVFAFERAGNYDGVYHVLNGLISPADGVNPEDINISGLVDRIGEDNKDAEIIVALKPTIEGETTTLYIKKIFEKKNIKVSRLSYGIPMGAEIDYLDELTLDRALSDRKQIQ